MEEMTKHSLWAHFWMVMSAFIVSILFRSNFVSIWQSLMTFFSLFFISSLAVFLIFAIPLERGRLKKSSWRYCWLRFFADGYVGDTINICHLPGLIGSAVIWNIVAFFVLFFGFVGGNILLPICTGEYVKIFAGNDIIVRKKIPWLPEKRIGRKSGFILRPWMLIAFFGLVWIFWELIIPFILSAISFAKVISFAMSTFYFIAGGIMIFIFIRVFIWLQIWTSLKNLLKSIDERFCIVGKVLDE